MILIIIFMVMVGVIVVGAMLIPGTTDRDGHFQLDLVLVGDTQDGTLDGELD